MTKSIMQNKKECYLCRKFYDIDMQIGLECHHIFGGVANRKISDKEGLVVWLCQKHHNTPPSGVHFNQKNMEILRKDGQRKFEETHTREEFIKRFGRNYDID